MKWYGVMPAITTPFDENLNIDHDFLANHCRWLIENGCSGIVTTGSLGESATLSIEEKLSVSRTCVQALGDSAPVVAGIASLSTAEALKLAQESAKLGVQGLMVLPPYVYATDWREMKAHVASVIAATDLPCMLYNNPVAYTTDFLPEHIQELAEEFSNLQAVKESSTDVRRISALRSLLDEQLALFVGVDDAVLEAVMVGAVGWIAGLVNAFPRESVQLFELAMDGEIEQAFALYRWFLPLLRLDTMPKLVQLIKLVQAEIGMGNSRVRPPRLELTGDELEQTLLLIRDAIAHRPQLA